MKEIGFLDMFRRKEEQRVSLEELLLQTGNLSETVTKDDALNIPSLAGCVELISNTVASIPIKLYQEGEGVTKEIKDSRVSLLNDDTGDTLDGFQFKKAIVEDYLLNGAGYAYINKQRNKIKSLHYVDSSRVSVTVGVDPIFKSYDILVNGENYREFEFIKVTRKTKNGATGIGIVSENNKAISVAYNTLVFEETLVKTGGNKKGFIKSMNKLTTEAIAELKAAWKKLYQNNSDNVVILNNGLDFKEATNTSVEMQLNENKKTNSNDICKLFTVPHSLLEGNATDLEYNNFIKIAILPILTALETALNKDLLLTNEKGSFYFEADTKDLMKGDIEKRFKAYEIATKNGILQIDEVRYLENYAPLGLDFIKLGLQDVLYNVKTKEIYTPNTNKTTDLNSPDKVFEGGEKENEDRDKE